MKSSKMLKMLVIASVLGATAAMPLHADEAWQKAAGVGEFASSTQDWAAIETAAKAEGSVVVYSVSSRIAKLVDGFAEKYGIEVIGHDIPSDLQLEKLRREHNAGVYAVDVIFNADISLLLNEALPNQLIWNFVPEQVVGDLTDAELSPILIQRHSSKVVYYNTALNPDGAPIDSIWDMTREEWKGRTLLRSPLEDSLMAAFFQTILQHPDAMATAYEKEFGEPVAYSETVLEAVEDNATIDAPDASMEFLYRFLANEPVFLGSTTKIFKNVGDVNQENPPIGITTFSKMRKNEEGVFAAGPIYGLDPVFGVTYPTALAMADMAPHPNAAKLMIRYMMEEGFKPWNEPGDYAARENVEAEQVSSFGLPAFEDLQLWKVDPEEVYNSKYGFIAIYLGLS